MGEKHYCRDCISKPCWVFLTFPVCQPNGCPDFKLRPEVEKPLMIDEAGEWLPNYLTPKELKK
jgi:hypothetical protein